MGENIQYYSRDMLLFLKLALSWDVTAEIHTVVTINIGTCTCAEAVDDDAGRMLIRKLCPCSATSCLCDLGYVTYSGYGIT